MVAAQKESSEAVNAHTDVALASYFGPLDAYSATSDRDRLKLLKRRRAQNDEETREVKARIDEDMHAKKLAKLGDLEMRTEEQVALAQRLVSKTPRPKVAASRSIIVGGSGGKFQVPITRGKRAGQSCNQKLPCRYHKTNGASPELRGWLPWSQRLSLDQISPGCRQRRTARSLRASRETCTKQLSLRSSLRRLGAPWRRRLEAPQRRRLRR